MVFFLRVPKPAHLSVSCLRSTMVEQCPKGAGWQDGDTQAKAHNNSVLHNVKPIKRCKTSSTWPPKHRVMRKRADAGTMQQKSSRVKAHTCRSLFCVLLSRQQFIWKHSAGSTLLPRQRRVQADLRPSLTGSYQARVLLWPLWCPSLIKSISDDELFSFKVDLIYIRSPRLFPSAPPTAQKTKKTNNWKRDSRGGPKGREWQQRALHLEIRHIQSWWNQESWREYSPRPSLSICIQRLELCCSDENKFSFSYGVSTLMRFSTSHKMTPISCSPCCMQKANKKEFC